MSSKESATGWSASPDMSSRIPLSPVSRAVGHSQVFVLLILGIGFLEIFAYQSEIHTFVLGNARKYAYSTSRAASSNVGPLVKWPILDLRRSSVAMRTERLGSLDEKQEVGVGSGTLATDPGAQSTDSIEEHASLRPPRAKKKDWKDIKVEAFQPLVASVNSNKVGSNFQLVVKVLALNDYASLNRCLTSLVDAEYGGDQVDIHIYIDHFEVSRSEKRRQLLAKEGTEDWDDSTRPRLPDRVATGVDSVKPSDWEMVEERLTEARKVLNLAESFPWKYGKKVIHYRTRTAGSQSQWVDAWWPSSDDEFALFVEDDAELSPLYYRYVRSLIATYYYQWSQFDRSLYGISLQRPQIVPGKNGRPLKVDNRTRLFKYQMVGIWGQVFFPKPWKEFRKWYDSKKSHNVKPVVDGMVTTDWYKQHGEKAFTPWFVKFVYSRGYFNLYTNFLKDRVLSVTHRDIGVKRSKYAGCDSALLRENGTYDLDLWHMAATWHIKRYDYCFKEVRVGRFANDSSAVGWVLDSTSQGKKEILMISAMGVPGVLVRNLLCTIRKLGIENYVVVGEDPEVLEELAGRGHATLRFENKENLTENIEKEMSAVSDLLNLGYTLWFTRADTVWVGNPLPRANTDGADVVGVENSQLSLFFVRSTKETTALWGSLNQELSSAPENVSGFANWKRAREKFIMLCQEGEKVQMRKLDQVVFIDVENLSVPSTLDGGDSGDAQVVVLSELRSLDDYDIKSKVHQLNLWNLDDDLVCTSLTC